MTVLILTLLPSVLAEDSPLIIKLKNPVVWQGQGVKMTVTHIGRFDNPDYRDSFMFLLVKIEDPSGGFEMDTYGTLSCEKIKAKTERYTYPDEENVYEITFPLLPKGTSFVESVTGKIVKRDEKISQLIGPYTLDQLKDGLVLNNGMLTVGIYDWRYGSWTEKMVPVSSEPDESDEHGQGSQICLRMFSVESRFNDMTVDVSAISWANNEGGLANAIYQTDLDSPEDPLDDEAYVGFNAVDCDSPCTGARVINVLPNSPSEKAGLKVGDVITTMDGKAVKNTYELDMCYTIGKPVLFSIIRDGKSSDITLTPEATGIWSGVSSGMQQILKKLESKVQKAKSGYRYRAYCCVASEPIEPPAVPEKVEFFTLLPGKVLRQAEFKFTNIPVPAEIWK